MFLGDADDNEIDFVIFDQPSIVDETVFLADPDAYGTVRFGERDRDWLATARLRAGGLFGERNQLLAYATGGLAFADGGDRDIEGTCTIIDDLDSCTFIKGDDDGDDFTLGFAVGGGLDWKLTQRFSIGAEYLYVDFGDDGSDLTLQYVVGDETRDFKFDNGDDEDNLHIARARASYHFGAEPAPAVAPDIATRY
jgi:outer membrane immunogenic protein